MKSLKYLLLLMALSNVSLAQVNNITLSQKFNSIKKESSIIIEVMIDADASFDNDLFLSATTTEPSINLKFSKTSISYPSEKKTSLTITTFKNTQEGDYVLEITAQNGPIKKVFQFPFTVTQSSNSCNSELVFLFKGDVVPDNKGGFYRVSYDDKLELHNSKGTIPLNEGIDLGEIERLEMSPKGDLWILSSKGLIRYDGDFFKIFSYDTLSDIKVKLYNIVVDKYGAVYGLDENRLTKVIYKLYDNKWTNYKFTNEYPIKLKRDKKGEVWVFNKSQSNPESSYFSNLTNTNSPKVYLNVICNPLLKMDDIWDFDFDSEGNLYAYGSGKSEQNVRKHTYIKYNIISYESEIWTDGKINHWIYDSKCSLILSENVPSFDHLGNGSNLIFVDIKDRLWSIKSYSTSKVSLLDNNVWKDFNDLASSEDAKVLYDTSRVWVKTHGYVYEYRCGDPIVTEVSKNEVRNYAVFPIPASDIINIKSSDPISQVELFDHSGKLILSKNEGDLGVLQLNNVGSGQYLLKIITESDVITRKIMVQ